MYLHLRLPGNLVAHHPGYFGGTNLHRKCKNNQGDERKGYPNLAARDLLPAGRHPTTVVRSKRLQPAPYEDNQE
jgi:hypothetical protein